MKQIQNKKHFKGFTLVELIIVITILAILATIAFISFQGYTKNARDGNRLSVVNNLDKGLDIYKVQTGKYPQPDGQILTGTINNQDLTYKGEIQDTLSRLLKLNKTPKDPVTQSNFVYGVTQDLKEYQIASILEGDITSFITPTYADSFNSKVEGSYKGYLRYSSGSTEEWLANIPSLLYNYSGSVTSTGIDLLNQTGTYYIINNGVNLPYAPVGIEKNNKKLTEIIKDKTKNNNSKIITIKKIDINKFIEDGTIPSYLGATSSGELIGSFGKTTTEELKQHITGTSSSVIQGSSSVVSNYFSGTGTTGDPYRLNGVSAGATTTIATSCQYYNTGATTINTGLTRGTGTCGNGSQGCLSDGVYLIDPDGSSSTFSSKLVYCDMNTDSGGWTMIGKRHNSNGGPLPSVTDSCNTMSTNILNTSYTEASCLLSNWSDITYDWFLVYNTNVNHQLKTAKSNWEPNKMVYAANDNRYDAYGAGNTTIYTRWNNSSSWNSYTSNIQTHGFYSYSASGRNGSLVRTNDGVNYYWRTHYSGGVRITPNGPTNNFNTGGCPNSSFPEACMSSYLFVK